MAILSLSELLFACICLFIVYIPALVLYRLYFSPLSKFPGPKIAAATLWYEYYYDVVKRGRYTWQIVEMHKQYGPIVRISPYELHIDDPEYDLLATGYNSGSECIRYYDELYVGPSRRRTEKYAWAIRGFGPLNYVFATIEHEHHRQRRGAVAPYFSKALVQQLEPSVQTMVDKVTSRLDQLMGTGAVVNLVDLFACMTSDVVCQYAFGAPYGYLDQPEFAPYFQKAVMQASEGFHFLKQFPWADDLFRLLPASVVKRMAPQLASLIMLGDMIREKILKVQADIKKGKKPEGQKTIIYDLITGDDLPPEEKTLPRLEAEAIALVAAGSMTVAHTLSSIAFHVINIKKVLHKLQEELASVAAEAQGPVKWNRLEQLPYLTAVITEGLRWSNGVSHRLQRISPDVDLHYQGYLIPRGTPVGMTSVMMHNSPTHFPDPKTFDPERWLQPDSARLRKYIVAFSKGSRQCLGMNLGYCELYLTLAAIFAPGRFRFELHATDVTDVEVYHDFFNACQRVESKGIRVKVE
ncbi:MAG: hypothetical protein LQ344_006608 [Seirophora lacunosa]|nr:MAG: hypothetical protein LQ344_006608 [Seirophora lacunosa]